MLLTATALTGLSYCSDQTPLCRGFCIDDATTTPADAASDHPLFGFADASWDSAVVDASAPRDAADE